MQKTLSILIYSLTTLLGVAAFLYPFWLPALARAANADQAHSGDAALMLTLLVALCVAVVLLEAQSQTVSAKSIALLGILVAMNSVLRFAEVAIPGPGGFSPVFLLIFCGGYVFGGRMGFLIGALTALVSALITGGVGPWLPYQMFALGWAGMSAPLCRPVAALLQRMGVRPAWAEVGALAVFGALWGLLFGAIMNIWFWPFIVGSAQGHWEPGIGLAATLRRYAVFYLITSFAWDLLRAAGNVLLVLLLGAPVLRTLRRFHQRFDFVYAPAPAVNEPAAGEARPAVLQRGAL